MKPAIIVWGIQKQKHEHRWILKMKMGLVSTMIKHFDVGPLSDINKVTRYFYHELVKNSRRQSTSTRHHEAQILWNSHLPVEKDLRRNFHLHHSLWTTPSNDIIIKLVFIGKLCLHEYAVTLNKLTDPTICWYYPIRLYSCPFSKYTLLAERRNSRYKLSSSVGHDNSSMM